MRINIAILRYYNYTNLISSLSDLNREYLEDGMHMDLAQKKIFAEKQGKINLLDSTLQQPWAQQAARHCPSPGPQEPRGPPRIWEAGHPGRTTSPHPPL